MEVNAITGAETNLPKCPVTGKIIESKLKECEIKFDLLELACSTGFFNGEGCSSATIRPNINPVIQLSLSQNYRECLKRFKKSVLGRGSIHSQASKHGVRFVLYVSNFEDVQFVICCLWSKLSRIKKEQYKEAFMKYMDNYRTKVYKGHSSYLNKNIKPRPNPFNPPVPATVNAVKKNGFEVTSGSP